MKNSAYKLLLILNQSFISVEELAGDPWNDLVKLEKRGAVQLTESRSGRMWVKRTEKGQQAIARMARIAQWNEELDGLIVEFMDAR